MLLNDQYILLWPQGGGGGFTVLVVVLVHN